MRRTEISILCSEFGAAALALDPAEVALAVVEDENESIHYTAMTCLLQLKLMASFLVPWQTEVA